MRATRCRPWPPTRPWSPRRSAHRASTSPSCTNSATADLAAGYQSFLAKARGGPTTEITVYLARTRVNVGCDDYLLPIDAHIAAEADVAKIALSMTQVMNDLAQTGSQVRVVLLDAARPIPPSVSDVALPQGLIPLAPAMATSFGLSAEIHDYEAPPKTGDANDAYATGLTGSLQQPFADVDTMLRATRLTVHQATAGGQTPWHASASGDAAVRLSGRRHGAANPGRGGRVAAYARCADEPACGSRLLVCGPGAIPPRTTRPTSTPSERPRRKTRPNAFACCSRS